MRISFLIIFHSLTIIHCIAQDTLQYYNAGVELAMDGQLDKAIETFTKSIKNDPNHPYIYKAWYNLGLCYVRKNNYEEAIINLNEAIKIKPDYLLGINMIGICKKNLNDYDGAIMEYSRILKIDSNYSYALQNRAEAYRLNNKIDSACLDWKKASKQGVIKSINAFNKFCTKSDDEEIGVIKELKLVSNNPEYGFSEKYPVKVGYFTGGGPQSQEAYLELLRDVNGKPIKFSRAGSCCHYTTENSPMGMGMLDMYQITFTDENRKRKTAIVYITFYDYEEPQILYGFKAK